MSIKRGIILLGTDCVVMMRGPVFPQNVTKWDQFDTNVNYAYLTLTRNIKEYGDL